MNLNDNNLQLYCSDAVRMIFIQEIISKFNGEYDFSFPNLNLLIKSCLSKAKLEALAANMTESDFEEALTKQCKVILAELTSAFIEHDVDKMT